MNLTRCKKSHYYDGDKYAECPHCARKDNMATSTVRLSDSVDTEQTERKNNVQGKALKDAVLDALEKKREREVEQVIARKDVIEHSFPLAILVEINGNHTGKVYILEKRCNYIGFEQDGLKVGAVKEQLPEVNAAITYHNEKQIFVLKPLGDEPTVQVGRMVLRENIMLRAYDKIVVKDTMLLFVPICGEHFRWEELSF